MRTLFFLTLLFTILTGCSDSDPSPQEQTSGKESDEITSSKIGDFDLQGHRGARGLFPENSLEGFVAAVDLMVNTIELDVVVSKDKQIVVSHEPWISSVICWGLDDKPVPAGKSLNIYAMNYSEVTNYNCGSEPHPDFPLQAKISTFKPLLSEVINEVESNVASLELPAVRYNIEIKSTPEGDDVYHPKPSEFCQLVLSEIRKLGVAKRCIIQSFDVRALQEMKQDG